jgi:ankyrin repeat protein
MNNLLIFIAFCFFSLASHAGVYDDILIAAQNDDSATVMNLIDRGMDVNTADPAGSTLLMIAARNGNQGLAKQLIKSKATINHLNRYGDSALTLAALKGQILIATILLEAGAEVNPVGWTPLQYASYGGHRELTVLLIKSGAKLDSPAPNRQTALMLAAKNGHEEIVRLLIAAGANISLQDANGKNGSGTGFGKRAYR